MAALADASFARLLAIVKLEDAVRVPVGANRFALVDRSDADLVLKYKWRYVSRYAQARGDDGEIILMHRLIMGPADPLIVDHEDGDGLNNQRYNLRVCTHQENMRNRCRTSGRSRFKGVWLSKGAWRAQIGINGKVVKLGTYTSEVKAARAYDKAATEHFGQFAKTNAQLGLY